MKITSSLFHAHIKCPTKCWLRFTGEPATGNPYTEWVQSRNESYRESEIERLRSEVPPDERADAPNQESLKTSKWRMGFDVAVATSQNLETCLQAVERAPSEGRGKSARFIPIRFVFTNKLGNDEKMLLTYDAYVLSQVFGHEVSLGKIVHGDSHATLTVKTSTLAGDLRKRLDKITALLTNPTPPDLVLNRHCAECEFQLRCRQKGLEKDDLSLLAAMSAKEREHYRSKGIFTVNQLSYTFRPRRTPKRAKNPAKPRYLALQALALRENTVYFHGLPVMPAPNTKVFLDIEGLPDRDFYYLIGALVVSDGHETFHSFWADAESDQTTMFSQFAEIASQLDDFKVFHFGDHDAVALKRAKAMLPPAQQKTIDAVLERAVNVLSLLYPHVYFPTYSNSLKALGAFLTGDSASQSPTGLHSIMWRMEWEAKRVCRSGKIV